MPSVALHLVRWLANAGVERIFSLSGNQILSIYDACLEAGVEIIHVRHEAAAVHMADAWGRLTGQPGVALLTAGPGHANGLSALYVAREAESPLVLLSGACPAATATRGGFQAMPQTELTAAVCKAADSVTRGEHATEMLRWAWETALSGRPGPVALSLPGDILEAELPEADIHPPRPVPQENSRELGQSLDVTEFLSLFSARRPLIVAGPAFCRSPARESLRAMSERTSIPAIATESPRGVNDPSLGLYAELLAQADVVLLLGKKLDWSLKFGMPHLFAGAQGFLQIDADEDVLQQAMHNATNGSRTLQRRQWRIDPVCGLAFLCEWSNMQTRMDPLWLTTVAEAVAWRPTAWTEDRSEIIAHSGRVHPLDVMLAVRPWLRNHDIFISDGGEFGQWAQALLHTDRRVINGPSGSIGGSIPFAIAASAAAPEARIVAMLGDGTFGFHALEFDTAVRYGLPFVAVVGNDARWNAESQLQAATYGADRMYGCDLLPTRYDRVVAELGGHGEHVTRARELPDALRRAFNSKKPACVNVEIEPAAAPLYRRE